MSFESRMAERRNELFEDLAQFVEQRLVEYGEPATKARVLANALVDYIADHWGGQMISIPKDHRRKLCMQEVEIYRQFNGDNYGDLALKYGMGERGMRKLIARVNARLAKQANNDQLQLLV